MILRSLARDGVRDLPSVVLVSRDMSRALALALEALEGGLPSSPIHTVTTTATLPDGKKAASVEGYTARGTLVVDVPAPPTKGEPGQLAQDAAVETIKNVSLSCAIVSDGGADRTAGRRGVVVHGADRLARHLQHAMRKILEASASSAVFVLTVAQLSGLDAALASRSVVVHVPAYAPPPDAREEGAAALRRAALLERFKEGVRAGPSAKGRAAQREHCKAHRLLLLEAVADRAGFCADAVKWLAASDALGRDDAPVREFLEVAAEADHKAALMSGHAAGEELAAALVIAQLRDTVLLGAGAGARSEGVATEVATEEEVARGNGGSATIEEEVARGSSSSGKGVRATDGGGRKKSKKAGRVPTPEIIKAGIV